MQLTVWGDLLFERRAGFVLGGLVNISALTDNSCPLAGEESSNTVSRRRWRPHNSGDDRTFWSQIAFMRILFPHQVNFARRQIYN